MPAEPACAYTQASTADRPLRCHPYRPGNPPSPWRLRRDAWHPRPYVARNMRPVMLRGCGYVAFPYLFPLADDTPGANDATSCGCTVGRFPIGAGVLRAAGQIGVGAGTPVACPLWSAVASPPRPDATPLWLGRGDAPGQGKAASPVFGPQAAGFRRGRPGAHAPSAAALHTAPVRLDVSDAEEAVVAAGHRAVHTTRTAAAPCVPGQLLMGRYVADQGTRTPILRAAGHPDTT